MSEEIFKYSKLAKKLHPHLSWEGLAQLGDDRVIGKTYALAMTLVAQAMANPGSEAYAIRDTTKLESVAELRHLNAYLKIIISRLDLWFFELKYEQPNGRICLSYNPIGKVKKTTQEVSWTPL